MNFEHIILEPEQKDLFIQMVEMVRSVPRENRSPIAEAKYLHGTRLVMPNGVEIKDFVYGDPETLADAGLIRIERFEYDIKNYIITPTGFQYYNWLMKEQGKPVERIEKHTFHYFEMNDFRNQYDQAYTKLVQADDLLWKSDSAKNFTVIGHICREAMQEFADQLYNNVKGEKSNEPKSHDKNRIKAVIEAKKKETGTTVRPFLDALNSYWDALSGLVQRQEHGGQKEGEPVNWEDSRRVVFQTVNVMVELDRTVGR